MFFSLQFIPKFPAIQDYGPMIPPYLMFRGNMTTSELRIPLVNDDTAELDEQFTVNLVEITPNVVVSMSNATVTIIDDDGEYRITIDDLHKCTYLHTC